MAISFFPLNPLKSFTASSIAIVGVWAIAAPAHAMVIDRVVNVQPIQVCQTDGSGCANAVQQLFAAETNKIWAQAGITFNFLSFQKFNDSNFLSVSDTDATNTTASSLDRLWDDPGHQANADPTVISMWFVNTIDPDPNGVTFGIARLGASGADNPGNRIAIANNVFSFNNGSGRLDTIAHELGHNLGLDHTDFGAGGPENVMTSGSDRAIPPTIDDITPSGAKLDQLTSAQIAEARDKNTVQPVPTPSLVLGLVGMGLSALRKKRKQQKEKQLAECN